MCVWNINTRWKPDSMQQPEKQIIYGGAGFFGEVQGPCGWKDSSKYSCCFSKCKSTWKTKLWPFNIYI